MKALTPWRGLAVLAALTLAATAATAQERSGPARIAILDDMSGPYAAVNGPGIVLAARMAIEDFGGKVLGQPIELLSSDDGGKPDTGLAVARRWIDVDHVSLITGLGNSAVGLGVRGLMRERKMLDIVVGGVSSDFTGKDCSPTGFHWLVDSHAMATGVTKATGVEKLNSWYFMTVDYTFGIGLERDATAAIKQDGGTVLGSTKFPFNTTDFSSYIIQAQASQAKVVALAMAGTDLINAVKASREFGVQKGGQALAAFAFYTTDVNAVGLDTAQGLLTSSTFFTGLNPESEAFTKRFAARHNGVAPTPNQAGMYSAVNHYLKAVAAAGTVDGPAVARKIREIPVNDFMTHDARVREDGQVMRDTYVLRIKSPAEVRFPSDYYQLIDTVPAEAAFRSVAEGGCPLKS